MKKIGIFLLFILIFAISTFADVVRVDIFATSDIHGNLYHHDSGIIPLAVLLDELGRDENSFLIDCGDLIQGMAVNRLERGEVLMQGANLLGYDFMVPGNHDFDFGYERMREIYYRSKAKVLMANLEIPFLQSSAFQVVEKQGIKFGFIGLTERNLRYKLLPRADLKFIDSDLALRNAIKAVMAQKVDVIILVMHDGLYFKGGSLYEIIKKFPMIDIVIGGHTHKTESGMRIRKSYSVQGVAHGKGVSHIKIEFDGNRKTILRLSSEIHYTKEVKKTDVPDKYHNILTEWKELEKVCGKRILIDTQYFKDNLSLQENLSLTKMKKFCSDGDVYINLPGRQPEKNYNANNLNMYIMNKILYFEDRYAVMEIDVSHLPILLKEVKENAKKFDSTLLYVTETPQKKSGKIKVVSTEYIWSGMGNPESQIPKLWK